MHFSSSSAYAEESMFYCVPPSFKNNYKESCDFSNLSGGRGNPKRHEEWHIDISSIKNLLSIKVLYLFFLPV